MDVVPSRLAGLLVNGLQESSELGSTEKPRSRNLTELLDSFNASVSILKIELLDAGFFYNAPRFDQTRTITGECAIEIVLRKHGRS